MEFFIKKSKKWGQAVYGNKKRKKRMIKIKGDVIFKSYTLFSFLILLAAFNFLFTKFLKSLGTVHKILFEFGKSYFCLEQISVYTYVKDSFLNLHKAFSNCKTKSVSFRASGFVSPFESFHKFVNRNI